MNIDYINLKSFFIKAKAKRFLLKPVAAALVFLFIFQPVSFIFAEESPIQSENPVSEVTIQEDITEDNTGNQVDINEKSNSEKENQSQESSVKDKDDQSSQESNLKSESFSSASTGTDPEAKPTENYMAKSVLPEVDNNTGALKYNFPINAPAGRNGLNPDLSLVYNSNILQNDSIFGYGWDINIPYIERLNKQGSDKLYDSRDFISSVDGELVEISENYFGPKSDSGAMHRYSYDLYANKFVLTDKQGFVFTYGESENSRQDDPVNAAHIYKWMLSSVADPNGNLIEYSYLKDQGQIYPSLISYSNIYQISFNLSLRQDVSTSYKTAFKKITRYLVSSVEIKTDGQTFQTYSISYFNNQTNNRTLLERITPIANGTTYPATSFNYQVESAKGFTETYGYTGFLDNSFSLEKNRKSTLFFDINGDSYSDILRAYEWTTYNYFTIKDVKIFNPGIKEWQSDATWQSIGEIMVYSDSAYSAGSADTRPIDLNGDLKTDLMGHNTKSNDPYVRGVKKINNGNGWADTDSWNFSSDPFTSRIGGYKFQGDINGDGFTDFLVANDFRVEGTAHLMNWNVVTSINNGSDFIRYLNTNGRSSNGPFSMIPFEGDDDPRNLFMFDINNDGLSDFIKLNIFTSCTALSCETRTNRKVYVNNGSGWEENTEYTFPNDINYYSVGPYGYGYGSFYFLDVNNDGYTDLITPGGIQYPNKVSAYSIYINRGKSWEINEDWFPWGTNCGLFCPVISVDADGNGSSDLLHVLAFLNNNQNKVDLLSSIILPTGGNIEITYKSSAQYKDAANQLLNSKLPINVQTVNSIIITDSVSGVSETNTYEYANGEYFYDSSMPLYKKFAGFGKVSKTDSVGNTIVSYYHTGKETDSLNGEYNDNYYKIGKLYRQEVYGSGGEIYTADVYKWDNTALTADASFVFMSQQLHQDINGQSGHKDIAISYTYNNSNGNLIEKTEWGRVESNMSGNFSDIGDDAVTTLYSYATDAAGVKFQISNQIAINASREKLSESKYYYDNLALGQLSNGNITKQELWDGLGYISSSKKYNSYGLVISEKDFNDKTTSYTYDLYNLYPSSIINPLGHSVRMTYNYRFGKVSRIQDANNFVKETDYDGLGRVIQERTSDRSNLSSGLQIRTNYTYTDSPYAVSVNKNVYTSPVNFIDSYTYFDGFGRLIQSKTKFEDNSSCLNCYQTQDTAYNNIGKIEKQSLPYLSSGSLKTSPVSDSALYTSFSYDALQRQTQLLNSLGTATTQYLNWQTTQTDQNGNRKDYINDAFGRLIQVNEYNSDGVYVTNYSYDLLGNLTNITDALSNVRNFTYNALSRRLSAEDLHKINDTTFGKYIYSYDPNGNLISKTDPNENITTYNYDSLNRQTSEAFQKLGEKLPTILITYLYDSCGKGFLCKVIQPSLNGTKNPSAVYLYFADGLVKAETKNIQGKSFTTDYSYDMTGNPVVENQPNSDQIKYVYNNQEKLSQVLSKTKGATGFLNIASEFLYSPANALSSISFANGITQTNYFDQAKQYRLYRKLATNSSGKHLQDSNYTYDNVGNILNLTDSSETLTAKNLAYTYDDLYRLLSVSASNTANKQNYTQTFAYDAIGNMLFNSQQGSYSYSLPGEINQYANPEAVLKIDSSPAAKLLSKSETQIRYAPSYPDTAVTGSYSGPKFTGVAFVAVAPKIVPEKLNLQNETGAQEGQESSVLLENLPSLLPTTSPSNDSIISDFSLPLTAETATSSNNLTTEVITPDNSLIHETSPTTSNPFKSLSFRPLLKNLFSIFLPKQVSAASVVPKPVIKPLSGVYAGQQQITITAISGAQIYYTIDGSNPTKNSARYIKPFVIKKSTTVKAIAIKTGYKNSDVVSNVYTIKLLPVIESFTASPTTITKGTQATLAWKLSGGTPTILTINNGIGSVLGLTSKKISPTTATTYTLTAKNSFGTTTKQVKVAVNLPTVPTPMVPPPTISPVAGNYTEAQQITVSSALPGVKIYYTVDGSTPTVSSLVYTAPFEISSNTTIKAIATKTGYKNSAMASSAYIIKIPNTSTILTYDNNGNLISETGIRNAIYTYNSNNQLTSVTIKDTNGDIVSTSEYLYDHTGQRVYAKDTANDSASTITYYPTKTYSETYSSSENKVIKSDQHIYTADLLIATIEYALDIKGNLAPKIYYNIADHLNSAQITTNQSANITELTDYYAYGNQRTDYEPTDSTFTQQKKYIGQYQDTATDLNYLNARYYNSNHGKFISQDPLSLNTPEKLLKDPQQLNFYSYARNNPIIMSDPSGLIPSVMEAAIMANQIYQNGHEGDNLIGSWQYNNSLTGGTGMKMGVYSRTIDDKVEYALVSKGTDPSSFRDWKNNIGQAFWSSNDLDAAVKTGVGFINEHLENETTFVGHSKGGPEAEACALYTNKNAILFNPAPFNASKYSDKITAYTAQVNEYIVREEFINLSLNKLANSFNSHNTITYLPSQYSLSWNQIRQQGLLSAIYNNAKQNHSMSSVIYGLDKK